MVRLAREKATKALCAVKSLPKMPPKAARQPNGDAQLGPYLAKLDTELATMRSLRSNSVRPSLQCMRDVKGKHTRVHSFFRPCCVQKTLI